MGGAPSLTSSSVSTEGIIMNDTAHLPGSTVTGEAASVCIIVTQWQPVLWRLTAPDFIDCRMESRSSAVDTFLGNPKYLFHPTRHTSLSDVPICTRFVSCTEVGVYYHPSKPILRVSVGIETVGASGKNK